MLFGGRAEKRAQAQIAPNQTDISEASAEAARQRQVFINLSMKNRLPEFSDTYECKVFCGTWNVCNKTLDKKKNSDLDAWLLPKDIEPLDIYAVAFQEIVDLNARNVVMDGSKSSEKASYWKSQIYDCLSRSGVSYSLLLDKNLVGLYLVVFVKEALIPQVTDCRGSTVGTGLMGVMGNKGGISIRFKLFDSSYCFICSHLKAHKTEVAGRNMDVKTICERTLLSPNSDNLFQSSLSPRLSNMWRMEEFSNSLTIDQHDFIFWLGDLNYRIGKVTTEEVFGLVETEFWRNLLESDQLNMERQKGTVFNDFIEPPINFLPTYKYQPGTAFYERRPEKKLRAPAWCDRILYRTKEPIEELLYDAAVVTVSDHMPVHAVFKVNGRVVDPNREVQIYKKLLAVADSLEKELSPKVELKDRIIDLGSLSLEEIPVRRKMTMSNVGKVPASWSFGRERDFPLWLTCYPTSGVVGPGMSTDIWLMFDFNPATAEDIIQTSHKSFDHIAVVEVKNSSHYFCPIAGSLSFDSFIQETGDHENENDNHENDNEREYRKSSTNSFVGNDFRDRSNDSYDFQFDSNAQRNSYEGGYDGRFT